MHTRHLTTLATTLLVFLTGCGSSAAEKTTADDAPDYEIVANAEQTITVEVDTTENLDAVFADVITDIDEEGGWFVLINCSTGATENYENRLATGRYAVGNLGAAQTGLDEGETDFEVQDNATCPSE